MQHSVKEGFSVRDTVHVVIHGVPVEEYPERQQGLVYADISVEDVIMPLHVICEHHGGDQPVDLVTAYIPVGEEWETPTRRRHKKRLRE